MNNIGLHIQKPKKGLIFRDTPLTSLAFFLGNPRGYNYKPWSPTEVENFRSSLRECPNLHKSNVVPHGCYLINLAKTSDEEQRAKSSRRLDLELQECENLGIDRMVLHPGFVSKEAAKDNTLRQPYLDNLVDGLVTASTNHPNVTILVENMTGTTKLCETFEELDWVVRHVDAKGGKVKTCLDTAHSWGSAHPMDTLVNDFSRVVGLDNLGAIHLNDSKVKFGSHVDRHHLIGYGEIPKPFFIDFINDTRLANIPVVCETRGDCTPVCYYIRKHGKYPEGMVELEDRTGQHPIVRLSTGGEGIRIKNTAEPSRPPSTSPLKSSAISRPKKRKTTKVGTTAPTPTHSQTVDQTSRHPLENILRAASEENNS